MDYLNFLFNIAVKLDYNDYLRDPQIVAFVDRWSLFVSSDLTVRKNSDLAKSQKTTPSPLKPTQV